MRCRRRPLRWIILTPRRPSTDFLQTPCSVTPQQKRPRRAASDLASGGVYGKRRAVGVGGQPFLAVSEVELLSPEPVSLDELPASEEASEEALPSPPEEAASGWDFRL